MPTDENEVCKIKTNLKNSSPGHDGIDINIIKHIKHAIITLLLHLCNQSFSQGKIPNELKIAKVIPIYKNETKVILQITDQFLYYLPFPTDTVVHTLVEKCYETVKK